MEISSEDLSNKTISTIHPFDYPLPEFSLESTLKFNRKKMRNRDVIYYLVRTERLNVKNLFTSLEMNKSYLHFMPPLITAWQQEVYWKKG